MQMDFYECAYGKTAAWMSGAEAGRCVQREQFTVLVGRAAEPRSCSLNV